jgi:trehalose/maltose transport system substrate-binding protein
MTLLFRTAAFVALVLTTAPLPAATLVISCGAVGKELELCRGGAEAWAERTGNQVEVVSAPSATNERLALYQQLLAAQASDIDVIQIDVIWPGMLARHLVDLTPYAGDEIRAHFSRRNGTLEMKVSGVMSGRGAPTRGSPVTPWNGSRVTAAGPS